jgi:hypothetical protein
LLDYHRCPACGCAELIATPTEDVDSSKDVTDGEHGEHGPDRACRACGTAVFIDPVLIGPQRRSRADVA